MSVPFGADRNKNQDLVSQGDRWASVEVCAPLSIVPSLILTSILSQGLFLLSTLKLQKFLQGAEVLLIQNNNTKTKRQKERMKMLLCYAQFPQHTHKPTGNCWLEDKGLTKQLQIKGGRQKEKGGRLRSGFRNMSSAVNQGRNSKRLTMQQYTQ